MQFSLDRKWRSHEQNQCSASDSVGLIFTRSYCSTLQITTPTMTLSLVKTSLKLHASLSHEQRFLDMTDLRLDSLSQCQFITDNRN